MTWGSWSDFFAMGGYALYVWGSYGVTLAVMLAELTLLQKRKRAALEDLHRLRNAGDGGAR